MNRNSLYIGATLRLPVTTPLSPISCMPCTQSLQSLPLVTVAAYGILVIISSPPTKIFLPLSCKLNLADDNP